MKDIRNLHRQAMELANQANTSLINGDDETYNKLMKNAFLLEKDAALELLGEFDSEPTRSVLFRSAATLAYNVGEYEEANSLIHLGLAGKPYDEIKEELNVLYQKNQFAIIQDPNKVNIIENSYLELLRDIAINIKIETKEKKYSKAILVENIIDLLKNVQTSFLNYTVVNFTKSFSKEIPNTFERVLNSFKKNSKTIAVDLNFASFGISIAADLKIMNNNLEYSSNKFSMFKSSLFENFKNEVLLADYDSMDFITSIKNKYNETERIEIYSPILISLKVASKYSVTIADKHFKKIIRKHNGVRPITENELTPLQRKIINNDDNDVLLKRTFELTSITGKKMANVLSENLTYAEFAIQYNQLHNLKETIYFINLYEVKVVFDRGDFRIEDLYFDINVRSKDFKEVQKSFAQTLIDLYNRLKNKSLLTHDETIKFDKMKSTLII